MTHKTVAEQREELFGDLNAYHLARLADCATPDGLESAGALFLNSIADAVAEQIAWNVTEDGQTTEEAIATIRDESHEIADGAADVYTHAMWAEFVDLAAYNEDPSEYGHDSSDMDQLARTCLYIIAERLVYVLLDLADGADI